MYGNSHTAMYGNMHTAMHGQTVQVGADRVGIVVGNDLLDCRSVPGNGRPGRS